MKLIYALLMSLLVISSCFAADAVQLNKYYRANCEDYTGTWQGFVTDPTDLYGNGGPWPVKISLYYADGYVVGKTSPIHYVKKRGVMPVKSIWAVCQNGALSQLFWGEKQACGSYSEEGVLISKNVLVLKLNVENAMAGATLNLFLKRQNKQYLFTKPQTKSEMMLGEIKSCH